MKKLFITLLIIILLNIYYFIIFKADNNISVSNSDNYEIASVSPVITELIYDASLGDNLVANTTFCNYPNDAKNKDKLGSYSNINYEYALSLGVNYAVIHKGMDREKEIFNNLNIKTIEVDTENINGLIESYDILGTAFNINEKTDIAKNKLISEIEKYKHLQNNQVKQKVLIVVFRPEGTGSIKKVTVASRSSIYNDILNLLGAENALQEDRPYPEITEEGIIALNPDVIIEITHNTAKGSIDEWKTLNNKINAVKNNRIYVTNEEVMSLVGPRLPIILEYFNNAIWK